MQQSKSLELLQKLLDGCDAEPIHIPGAIQSHGVLLGIEQHHGSIAYISDNYSDYFDAEAAALLGQSAERVLNRDLWSCYQQLQASESAQHQVFSECVLNTRRGQKLCDVSLHISADYQIVEIEFIRSVESHRSDPDQPGLTHLYESILNLRKLDRIDTLANLAAEYVYRISGYDRVKVYRFDMAWSGEVISEAASGRMESYLGFNFPASDIPKNARDLYALNPYRQIVDSQASNARLLAVDTTPLDLSKSLLRAVSPVHIEYLNNMEVRASLSLPLFNQDQLWGLVVCHHAQARKLAQQQRMQLDLIAQIVSMQISRLDKIIALQYAEKARRISAELFSHNHQNFVIESIRAQEDALMDLLQASALAVYLNDRWYRSAQSPDPEHLHGLQNWLRTREAAIYHSSHLAKDYSPAVEFADKASGIVAVRIDITDPRNRIIWFRPEHIRTVTWAGNPDAKLDEISPAATRLSPRHSFAKWQQELRQHSLEWHPEELESSLHVAALIANEEREYKLQQANDELNHSNTELERFASVASHDLQEPLRKIRMFSEIIVAQSGERLNAEDLKHFGVVTDAAERMQTFINDLLAYSRAGQKAKKLAWVDLNDVIATIKKDISDRLNSAPAVIEHDHLPRLLAARIHMQQLFSNLIGNALKYQPEDQIPQVHIGYCKVIQNNICTHEISIQDNGIGFDMQLAKDIFKPLTRLHKFSDYPGSGIGLAICDRIMQHYDGAITVRSSPGQGTCFTVRLPEHAATQ